MLQGSKSRSIAVLRENPKHLMFSRARNFFIFLFLFFCLEFQGLPQSRYIVVERLGGKRIRLTEGDEFHFKLKGENALFNDVIFAFQDSTINISSGVKIHTKNITSV